jgi:hypothetical protein
MARCQLLIFVAATLAVSQPPSVVRSEEPPKDKPQPSSPPKPEVVERLVREKAFADQPQLPRTVKFRVHKHEVKGLWEALECEVFEVEYLGEDGTQFNGYSGLYHDGKVSVFATNLGGNGLMSGVMHKGTLYGTSSWGSGLHRSHLFALSIAEGKPKVRRTGGFTSKDLFMSGAKDGTLVVQSGDFDSFDKWKNGTDFGVLATDEKELRVVDAEEAVIEPEIGLRKEK